MPWDWFCPQCTSTLVGSMTDDPDLMKREASFYEGKIIYCSTCKKYWDFTTCEEVKNITIKDWETSKVLLGG